MGALARAHEKHTCVDDQLNFQQFSFVEVEDRVVSRW